MFQMFKHLRHHWACKLPFCLLRLTACLLCYGAEVTCVAETGTGGTLHDTPVVVQQYLAHQSSRLENLSSKQTSPSPMEFHFSPLFWDSSVYKSRKCWLVGYQTADEKQWTYSDVVLIDEQQNELFRYPHGDDNPSWVGATGFTDGRYIDVGAGEALLALATPPHRNQVPGAIELYSIAPEQRVMARFASEQQNYSKFWESMFYFYDFDSDGRREIVVNRRVHTRQENSTYKLENQKLVYRIREGGTGIEPMEIASEELVRIVKAVKNDKSVPFIAQYGLPFETIDSPDFGEAIFPSEEQWRKVRYSDTGAPDLTATAAMLPQAGVGEVTTPTAEKHPAQQPPIFSIKPAAPSATKGVAENNAGDHPMVSVVWLVVVIMATAGAVWVFMRKSK